LFELKKLRLVGEECPRDEKFRKGMRVTSNPSKTEVREKKPQQGGTKIQSLPKSKKMPEGRKKKEKKLANLGRV